MPRITGNYLGKVPQEQLIIFSEMSLHQLREAHCRKRTLKETRLQVMILSWSQMRNWRGLHLMMPWNTKSGWMSYKVSSKQMSQNKLILFSHKRLKRLSKLQLHPRVCFLNCLYLVLAILWYVHSYSLVFQLFKKRKKQWWQGVIFALQVLQLYDSAKNESTFTSKKAESALKFTMPSL